MDLLKSNIKNYEGLKKEIQQGANKNWVKLKAIVEFLKKARGPTGCSEILMLSRLLRRESKSINSLLSLDVPWLKKSDVDQLYKIVPRESLINEGFELKFMQMVLSNGYFAELALKNGIHFAPLNWSVGFSHAQWDALRMIDDHINAPNLGPNRAPIPADAIALVAFGLHFMTDAFSSAHMRTPRDNLGEAGALLSKIMHDIDGKIGLYVKNGFGDKWRAFGDGLLRYKGRVPGEIDIQVAKARP